MTRRNRIGRPATYIAAAALATLVGALVWLPARLVLAFLPSPITCADAGGTLWRGRCGALTSNGAALGALSWRLQARPLLGARIVADLEWSHQGSRLATTLDASLQRQQLRGLRGTADLASLRALPIWPPAVVAEWTPGEGRLRLDIVELELRGGRVQRLVGVVDADGLVALGRERWVLGDYRLGWRDAASPLGELTDRGGPLEVRARLQPLPDGVGAAPPGGSWRITGEVRARDAAWRTRLGMFGPPGADGRHTLSIDWR